ncbi:MAG TPA: substrate-binding domain-containing protein [Spirochaetia bacterium]|jgi:ABC-type sugar transport system substrate-binding protein|nr:substrate-binding domain-containing protein [Spirochaetia bacterium]
MARKVSVVLLLLLVTVSGLVFAAGEKEKGTAEKVYKVGVIPKFIAEDYFIACERGFRVAEKELGNVKVDWVGDTMAQCSAANQKNYIQGFIDKRYDAILVSALDPESYADTLKAARSKGIKVITWDADVNPAARDYFVNQAEGDQIAIQLLKGLAGDLKDYTATNKATVALVSTTNDSPNQNAWLKAISNEYRSKKDTEYKHINLMDEPNQIVYAGNDQGTADEKIKSLLSANKNIKGIAALSSNTVPAVATARDQLGITDSIKIVGVSVPEASRKDMETGRMSAVVLWQPFDLGYLTLHVTMDVLQGKSPSGSVYKSPLSGTNMTVSFTDGTTVINYPAEGHKILANNEIILGPPIVWNLKNIDRFRGYPNEDSGMAYFLK